MLLATLVLAPTVAVMPFSDLSSSSGSIGEAIRESVTADLREVSGLRVIERARLDEVVKEQRLQQSRADLDPSSSAKLGRLLGASLIVTGAYQKVAQNVRLTARFVKVETGEIVGSAKVDGPVSAFLSLQDKVTAALLRSAGLRQSSDAVLRRARPKLSSARTIELYGDAVLTDDVDKKKKLLQQALDSDPEFSYATRDLDALEKRLAVYDANARKESDVQLTALKREIGGARDADELNMKYNQFFGRLLVAGRWRRMLAECKEVRRHPPPKPRHTTVPAALEFCGFYEVSAYNSLRDWESLLRAGEKFVAQYPTSIWFEGVRNMMDNAVREKREADVGRKNADAEVATLPVPDKYAPCKLAVVYRKHRAYREAKPYIEQCIWAGGGEYSTVAQWYESLAFACQSIGDFTCERKA